jgi:glycosyltransferase involved in cell wall biosynthesis
MTVISVQAFGIGAPGGGPRILRALLADPPLEVHSVSTGLRPPPSGTLVRETWLPARRDLGRVESTRLAGIADALEAPRKERLAQEIVSLGRDVDCAAIHSVAHSADFIAAERAARVLDVPFVLSIHDDLRYVVRHRMDRRLVLSALGDVWRRADRRLVISDALGRELCRRDGARPFSIVTDGLRDPQIAPAPRERANRRPQVYFAGLFHLAYRRCFDALLLGLEALAAPARSGAGVTVRSGSIPVRLRQSSIPLQVLPFGSEEDVARDLDMVDLLYLPLPFGRRYRDFVRFSLSTKLVTYLGSGLPILYHGPAEGPAYELLGRHRAGLTVTSLDPDAIARALNAHTESSDGIVSNALSLARERFRIDTQRLRFWGQVQDAIAERKEGESTSGRVERVPDARVG